MATTRFAKSEWYSGRHAQRAVQLVTLSIVILSYFTTLDRLETSDATGPLAEYITIPSNTQSVHWTIVDTYNSGCCILPTPDQPMDIYAIVVLDAGAPHAGGRLREIEWRKNAAKTLLPEEILNSGAASGENVRFQGADVGELFTPASS